MIGLVGVSALSSLLPANMQQAFIDTVSNGSIYERIFLCIKLTVLGQFAVSIGHFVFRRIEWRSVPQRSFTRWIERKLWSRLFYSARLDRADYRRLRDAAESACQRKSGINHQELSWPERAAFSYCIDHNAKGPSSSSTQGWIEWSYGMCAFCAFGILAVIVMASAGTLDWVKATSLTIGYAIALALHVRWLRGLAEQLVFEEGARLAAFLLFEGKTDVNRASAAPAAPQTTNPLQGESETSTNENAVKEHGYMKV